MFVKFLKKYLLFLSIKIVHIFKIIFITISSFESKKMFLNLCHLTSKQVNKKQLAKYWNQDDFITSLNQHTFFLPLSIIIYYFTVTLNYLKQFWILCLIGTGIMATKKVIELYRAIFKMFIILLLCLPTPL